MCIIIEERQLRIVLANNSYCRFTYKEKASNQSRKERANLSKPQEKEQQTVEEHDDSDLRGTLFFNMLLGIFLVLSWFGVWAIYMSR